MIYIIDTHALVWFLDGDLRLGNAAKNILTDSNSRLVIPTIVLAEMQYLFAKGRVGLDLDTVWDTISIVPNVVIYPLDELVVKQMPSQLDIHDGIIVATALLYKNSEESVAVITKDAEIINSRTVEVIW